MKQEFCVLLCCVDDEGKRKDLEHEVGFVYLITKKTHRKQVRGMREHLCVPSCTAQPFLVGASLSNTQRKAPLQFANW